MIKRRSLLLALMTIGVLSFAQQEKGSKSFKNGINDETLEYKEKAKESREIFQKEVEEDVSEHHHKVRNDDDQEASSPGKAYGKYKQGQTGREFGEKRSTEAKNKFKNDESKIKNEAKIQIAQTKASNKINAAKIRLEEQKQKHEISADEYEEKNKRILQAEERLKAYKEKEDYTTIIPQD